MIKMVKIPRILIEHEYYKNLSDRAKVLYGILSEKKQDAEKYGWVDEQGCLYVVFPKRKMQEELACSRYRLDLVTKELVTTDLIALAYGIRSPLERRIYVHSLKEECPWIMVEYGPRTPAPVKTADPAKEKEPDDRKEDTKEKAGDTGCGKPESEDHDPDLKDINPVEIFKEILDAGKDDPAQKEICWQVMLEALCSVLN